MELYSTIRGKGQPLLILHGLFGSSDNWLTIAKALSQKFTVHSLDLRNHGRSPHSEEHNYAAMAEDVREYVAKHKLSEIYLLGHSMGGKVAMLFTLNYPKLVKKLLIADIAPKNYQKSYAGHIKILEVINTIDLENLKTRKEIENKVDTILQNKKVTLLVMKNLYRTKAKTFAWRINAPVLYKQLENITRGIDDWTGKNCEVPTIFIKGENSNYLSIYDNFTIKKYFKNSELTVIPNSGHWLHAEQPELVINTILYFTE